MRIAIVNDSAMAVEVMRRTINATDHHQIAWLARDGAEAVQACAKDTPDLILMDLIMPVMDGVEATRRIMANSPCAILVVTATVAGHTGKVFQALGAGAVDVVATPVLGSDGAAGGAAALVAKIETLGRLFANGNGRSRPSEAKKTVGVPPFRKGLVAIGASAGGPAAVATILANLPVDFPAAVVIVQHVDKEFAPLMASWLNEQSRMPVRLAQEGDQPEPGVVLMAATNDHLLFLDPRKLGYSREPSAFSYRPSVDVFFHSAARLWDGEIAGVLLTGMGRDGAGGLKALRTAGALTIAQDSESCVVFGMPKAALQLDAAAEVLPPARIASRLNDLFVTSRAAPASD